MLAYVNLIQRREKELGVDVLTHQKWSGAAYVDGILGAIQSGNSGSKSMGEGNTEKGMSIDLIIFCSILTGSCPQASRREELVCEMCGQQIRSPGLVLSIPPTCTSTESFLAIHKYHPQKF